MRWLRNTFRRTSDTAGGIRDVYVAVLPFIDGVATLLAIGFAYAAATGAPTWPGARGTASILVTVLGAIVTFASFGLYRREHLLAGTDEYARVVRASTSLAVALALFAFASDFGPIARGWLFWFWPALAATAGIGRMCARKLARAIRRPGGFLSRVVVVGVDQRAVLFAARLAEAGYEVVGFLDDYRAAVTRVGSGDWPVLGAPHDLSRAADLGADEAIIVPSAVSWESRRACLSARGLGHVPIRVLADRDDVLIGHINVSQRAGVPVYSMQETRLSRSEAAIKRGFDLGVACALLLLVGPFAL